MARRGLPLTDYGVVCSRTAKMQRMAVPGEAAGESEEQGMGEVLVHSSG